MASIDKRLSPTGKKSYRVQIRLKGYPPQTQTFDRKTDAEEWGATVERELKAGRYLASVEGQRHTVREMLEAYRATVLLPTSVKRQRR